MFSSLRSFWQQLSRRKAWAQRWTCAVTMATRLWRPSRLSPPPRLDPPWRTSPPPSPNFDLDTRAVTHSCAAWSVFVCRALQDQNHQTVDTEDTNELLVIQMLAHVWRKCSALTRRVHQKCNIYKWSSLNKNTLPQHRAIFYFFWLWYEPFFCMEKISRQAAFKNLAVYCYLAYQQRHIPGRT